MILGLLRSSQILSDDLWISLDFVSSGASGVWGLVLGEYCRLAVLKNLRCGPDDPVRVHLHLALGATFVKNAAVTACRS
jgi:hypothetical protein